MSTNLNMQQILFAVICNTAQHVTPSGAHTEWVNSKTHLDSPTRLQATTFPSESQDEASHQKVRQAGFLLENFLIEL